MLSSTLHGCWNDLSEQDRRAEDEQKDRKQDGQDLTEKQQRPNTQRFVASFPSPILRGIWNSPPVENTMRKIYIPVSLLLFLPLMCVVLSDLRDKSIIQSGDQKKWKNAQAYCREHHTDLYTFRDLRDTKASSRHGWIGFYRPDSASPWRYSRGDEIVNCTLSSQYEGTSGGDCAYRSWSRTYSGKCDEERNYICYEERLVLVKKKRTWEHALHHCRSLEAVDPSKPGYYYKNNRYELATLLTEDDMLFAKEMIQGYDNGVWTGLRHLASQWMWIGGEPMQKKDFEHCKGGRCGALLPNGNLKPDPCSELKYFFCYKRP